MDTRPAHFIDEPVEVFFSQPPALEKKPTCPDAFLWRGERFVITEMLAEWVDYQRRGRMSRNMQPQHAAVAATRGSWGVGRFFFRVSVEGGRIFEIYYDRAPKNAADRKGHWVLFTERVEDQ